MENKFNPFLVSGYKGAEYFCDRVKETTLLKKNITNNKHTTLFAIRRLGKTGLIQHVFNAYAKNTKVACIYIDILGTNNIQQFTNELATAIYNRFPEKKGIGKKIIEVIQSLRPLISFDTLTGGPEVSFELSSPKLYEKTIGQLFSFLDDQGIKVVFAIDEFQQILSYPEQNAEAILRTYMQQLQHTQFIFCGSNQKMMHEIFNDAKRPFFASCTSVHLDFIDAEIYQHFIQETFTRHKKKISSGAVDFILEWTDRHTFYTQYLCNYVFALPQKQLSLQDVQQAVLEIFEQNESVYYQYKNLLTAAQWNLLRAIAIEDKVYNPHAKRMIQTYNLGSSSLITRGMDALLAKEMIYYNAGVEKPYYEVYDKFLKRWLQRQSA